MLRWSLALPVSLRLVLGIAGCTADHRPALTIVRDLDHTSPAAWDIAIERMRRGTVDCLFLELPRNFQSAIEPCGLRTPGGTCARALVADSPMERGVFKAMRRIFTPDLVSVVRDHQVEVFAVDTPQDDSWRDSFCSLVLSNVSHAEDMLVTRRNMDMAKEIDRLAPRCDDPLLVVGAAHVDVDPGVGSFLGATRVAEIVPSYSERGRSARGFSSLECRDDCLAYLGRMDDVPCSAVPDEVHQAFQRALAHQGGDANTGAWRLCMDETGRLARPISMPAGDEPTTIWFVPAEPGLAVGRGAEQAFHALHPLGRDPWSAALAVRAGRRALQGQPSLDAWDAAFEGEEDAIRLASEELRSLERVTGADAIDAMLDFVAPCDEGVPLASQRQPTPETGWYVDLDAWSLTLPPAQRSAVTEVLVRDHERLAARWSRHLRTLAREPWCGLTQPSR